MSGCEIVGPWGLLQAGFQWHSWSVFTLLSASVLS